MKSREYELDKYRYKGSRMPAFQKWYRRCQSSSGVIKLFCRLCFAICKRSCGVVFHYSTSIGGGCYFGHPWGININDNAVIGCNCNIHKGVTIGQENRGLRKGSPKIGNKVWIGINSTIVGAIHIGDDVLIAPNSFVNCDIPPHSIVYGNPCIVKHRENAIEDYIMNECEIE